MRGRDTEKSKTDDAKPNIEKGFGQSATGGLHSKEKSCACFLLRGFLLSEVCMYVRARAYGLFYVSGRAAAGGITKDITAVHTPKIFKLRRKGDGVTKKSIQKIFRATPAATLGAPPAVCILAALPRCTCHTLNMGNPTHRNVPVGCCRFQIYLLFGFVCAEQTGGSSNISETSTYILLCRSKRATSTLTSSAISSGSLEDHPQRVRREGCCFPLQTTRGLFDGTIYSPQFIFMTASSVNHHPPLKPVVKTGGG